MTKRRARSSHRPLSSDYSDAAPPGSLSPLPRWVERLCVLQQRVRSARRLVAISVWIPGSVAFRALLLRVPGTAKIRWSRVIFSTLCRLLGIRVRTIGHRAGTTGGRRARKRGERPVIYISNHSSWLDVLVLGKVLPTVFVAKSDILGWPGMGLIARIGETIFVSRNRSSTGRESDEMFSSLNEGNNMVLFPEGTSSDGSRVLPFMSTFFAIAKPPQLRGSAKTNGAPPLSGATFAPGMTPIIQPVSLVYDQLNGLPVQRLKRPVFAWYAEMELGPHLWQLTQWKQARASVIFHEPLDPELYPSRKALAQATWKAVAQGAADLRQNNPDAAPEPAKHAPTSLPRDTLRGLAGKLDKMSRRLSASCQKTRRH
ncbi:1-acyl-sn-glycerol-3-phosphate acyltransferase [Acetobacter thailandicus]|nr:1-acyl-sn-glycerol-3-phosphate acyltransferase [Acetobacter thailandicus]